MQPRFHLGNHVERICTVPRPDSSHCLQSDCPHLHYGLHFYNARKSSSLKRRRSPFPRTKTKSLLTYRLVELKPTSVIKLPAK